MDILIKPIITEESLRQAAQGRFTFQVHLKANKPEIVRAVAEAFNVHPVNIATMIVKGHTKRSARSRKLSMTPSFKKAILTLKKGEKIDLFEITGEEHHHHA